MRLCECWSFLPAAVLFVFLIVDMRCPCDVWWPGVCVVWYGLCVLRCGVWRGRVYMCPGLGACVSLSGCAELSGRRISGEHDVIGVTTKPFAHRPLRILPTTASSAPSTMQRLVVPARIHTESSVDIDTEHELASPMGSPLGDAKTVEAMPEAGVVVHVRCPAGGLGVAACAPC